jgi:hypothetical protein
MPLLIVKNYEVDRVIRLEKGEREPGHPDELNDGKVWVKIYIEDARYPEVIRIKEDLADAFIQHYGQFIDRPNDFKQLPY